MTDGLGRLVTEGRLEDSLQIDTVSTEEILRIINQQDKQVAFAVEREIAHIARAVDLIAERLRDGGRLIYVGAGTSGRLGVLDAAEIPPTFGGGPDLVQGIVAGGLRALAGSQEGAEDSEELGRRDISARAMAQDAVVGIAASGRTPDTVAAVKEARSRGCLTVAVTNNPDSPLAAEALVAIAPVVGPEVLMGSTRMKAGTAQKMVLNMLSTGIMIRLGKVYSNLMVDMQPSNEKLRLRAVRMVMEATGASHGAAATALEACGYHSKCAIICLLTGCDAAAAISVLTRSDGYVRKAMELVRERSL